MKMKPKVGNVITATSMVVAVIALTISAVLFVLSANQHHTNASLTVSYVATNVYVEVDAKYQKKLDASPTALTGGPLTFQPTGVSSTGTLSAGDIVLSPNDNYVLFTYSFKNKATVGGYDIAVTLTDTVNKVNTKVYYAYNSTSTAMSTMATNMTNSKTTTAPQNITIPAQQTKYLYIYVEIDDWYFGASYTSDASHFLKFDISSTTVVNFDDDYQMVDYIRSTGTQWIDANYTMQSNYFDFDIEAEAVYTGREMSLLNVYNRIEIGWSQTQWRIFSHQANDGALARLAYNDYDLAYNNKIHFHSWQDASNRYFQIDDMEIQSATDVNTGIAGAQVVLLCYMGNRHMLNGKLYRATIKDNGVVVRDFVPCYRKSDGEIGLYDTINGVFYTNAGTGTFIKGPDLNVPLEYTEVDYIESTGTQFIDTGVTPSYDLTYSLDFTPQYDAKQKTSGENPGFFGVYSNSFDGQHYDAFTINFSDGSGSSIYCWREYREIGESYKVVWSKTSTGMSSRVNNITLSDDRYFYVNGNKVTDGNNVQLDAPSQDTFQDSILIFGRRTTTGVIKPFNYFNLKVYGLSMSKGGVLIRDYVPCYRKSDNKPGLYDTVNGVFYTNAGTGEFLLPE